MARRNLLRGFRIPKSTSVEHSVIDRNHDRFVAFPFERGFGITVGNTLRRVLLSSIQGYAITTVCFQCNNSTGTHFITSEFEPIPGVKQDICQIIAKLKKLRFVLTEPEADDSLVTAEVEPTYIEVSCKGPGVVKGSDFSTRKLKVVNEELELFDMMEDVDLTVSVQVDFNRGYIPSDVIQEMLDNSGNVVPGIIPVDAIFSPVTKVSYSIEPARVGQRNDYDKLVLDVWTDGTISPEDALAEAAKITKDHFSIFINFDESLLNTVEEVDEEQKRIDKILNTSVEELELSVRSGNCLKNANIRTIGDLTKMTEDEITKTRNFGKKSLLEIKDKLKEWNLELGMTDKNDLKAAKFPDNKEQNNEA